MLRKSGNRHSKENNRTVSKEWDWKVLLGVQDDLPGSPSKIKSVRSWHGSLFWEALLPTQLVLILIWIELDPIRIGIHLNRDEPREGTS